jgi:CheY-like chemotaxis protein
MRDCDSRAEIAAPAPKASRKRSTSTVYPPEGYCKPGLEECRYNPWRLNGRKNERNGSSDTMNEGNRRVEKSVDRRMMPRGGRRPHDVPGRYPPILLADGYEAARNACVGYLNLFGFEVAEVALPAEALALVDSGWAPQVILADAENAARLSRRFASLPPETVTPPIIVMAGDLRNLPRPIGGILVKPFRMKTMLRTVRRVLRRRWREAMGRRTLRIAHRGPL